MLVSLVHLYTWLDCRLCKYWVDHFSTHLKFYLHFYVHLDEVQFCFLTFVLTSLHCSENETGDGMQFNPFPLYFFNYDTKTCKNIFRAVGLRSERKKFLGK